MSIQPPRVWTDDRVEELKALWATKLTFSQIAKKLGTTTGAISGKLNRLKLLGRKPPALSPEERKERARLRLNAWRAIHRNVTPKPPKAPRKVVVRPHAVPPTNDPVTLMDRKRSQCAYIVGHHLMCGAPTVGYPINWCEFHYNITHRRAA
jgi:hypothetical protein